MSRRSALALAVLVVTAAASVGVALALGTADHRDLKTRLVADCERAIGSQDEVLACVEATVTEAVLDGAAEVGDVNRAFALAISGGAVRIGYACHDALHDLGERLAAEGWSPEEVVTATTYGCYGGVWHGFFESLGASTSPDSYVSAVVGRCAGLVGEPEALQFDCLHGLGHGLGMTPGVSLADALGSCASVVGDDVYPDRDPLRDCATGVVSSYVSRATIQGHGPDPGPGFGADEVRASCGQLEPFVFADTCYERIAAVWVANLDYDVDDVAAGCVASGEHAGSCAYGLGRIGLPSDDYPCEALGELAGECYRGVVETWVPAALAAGMPLDVCSGASSRWRSTCEQHLTERVEFELGWDWVLARA